MRVTTRFQNRGEKEIGLQVEPWGEYYRIAPGANVDVIVEGPVIGDPNADPLDDGVIVIRTEPDCITVYVWQSAEVEVVGAEMAPWPAAATK